MDIRIQAAASSDVGRHRRTNEDCFGFDMDRGLFVVCDGVGGANAGEVASRSAVDGVLNRFSAELPDSNAVAPELQRSIQAANRLIFEAAQADPIYAGMATTIVAAHFDGARMWIAHVGDSRAYLLREECLHRLTDDDSKLSQMLREGQHIPPEEMAHWDSVLTQAIGASDLVIPTITAVQVQLGDCFVLATDGICKAVHNADMLALLLSASSPEQACSLLTRAANERGGYDNATCIVVKID